MDWVLSRNGWVRNSPTRHSLVAQFEIIEFAWLVSASHFSGASGHTGFIFGDEYGLAGNTPFATTSVCQICPLHHINWLKPVSVISDWLYVFVFYIWLSKLCTTLSRNNNSPAIHYRSWSSCVSDICESGGRSRLFTILKSSTSSWGPSVTTLDKHDTSQVPCTNGWSQCDPQTVIYVPGYMSPSVQTCLLCFGAGLSVEPPAPGQLPAVVRQSACWLGERPLAAEGGGHCCWFWSRDFSYGSVQDVGNSIVLAMELPTSCTECVPASNGVKILFAFLG